MQRSPSKVGLAVGGVSYHRWISVDVDSDILTPADAFQVTARLPAKEIVGAFREGVSVDVYVGDDRQMAGVIDKVTIGIERGQDTLTIIGRDKGAFLVDNEAEAIKAANYTAETLAQKLLKPAFGIRNVIVSNEANRKLLAGKKDRTTKAATSRRGAPLFDDTPRIKTKIDPGQRIAQILDEHLRQLGVTWWLTAQGDLFIGKPNYEQDTAYNFLLFPRDDARRASNNVLSARIERSIDDRYTEIIVAGQSGASAGSLFGSGASRGSKFKASAKDPDLAARGIDRKLILVDGDILNHAQAQRRADFEMGRRRLNALMLTLTVPGFGQGDRLFAVDTLATVRIPHANIEGVFYVGKRRFMESREKRRTELTLWPKGVYLP